jgi:hypothetical protein
LGNETPNYRVLLAFVSLPAPIGAAGFFTGINHAPRIV